MLRVKGCTETEKPWEGQVGYLRAKVDWIAYRKAETAESRVHLPSEHLLILLTSFLNWCRYCEIYTFTCRIMSKQKPTTHFSQYHHHFKKKLMNLDSIYLIY